MTAADLDAMLAPRYRTVEYCTDPRCRCDDRNGVVLYDGPDRAEADEAMTWARYPDVAVEAVEPDPDTATTVV